MFDAFLKLDGIKGESHDDKHKGEIEVLAFSWGVSQPTSVGSGGGGGAGKANFQEFMIQKKVDLATPQLFLACCTGEHLPDGLFTLEQRGSGRGGESFLKITLTDILVSSVKPGGAGGDNPTESVSLNFAKVEIEFQDERGHSQTALCGGSQALVTGG
jgi:type VI secretion system secreted protein Hcp